MFQGVSSLKVLAKRLGVDPSQVSFGDPIPEPGSLHTVTVELISRRDQSVKRLRYDRRSVSAFIPLGGLELSRGDYTTTIDLLPVLTAEYNIVLSDSEIIVDVLDKTTDTFTVRLAPSHLLYVGNFTVRLKQSTEAIANLVPMDYLVDCVLCLECYPDPLSYFHFTQDFTPIRTALRELVPGDRVPASLASLLNACTEHEWTYGILAAPDNLYWARLLYNGSTAEYPTANQSYTHVVVVEISEQYCTNLKGVVHLHYNGFV